VRHADAALFAREPGSHLSLLRPRPARVPRLL